MKLTSKGKERKQTPNDLTGGGRLSKMEELVSSDDERRWYEEGRRAIEFKTKLSWQIYDSYNPLFSSASHDLSRVADELRFEHSRFHRILEIHESVVAPSSAAQIATYARLVADPDNRIPSLYITLDDITLASAPPRSILSKLRKKCKEFEDRWNDHFVYPLSVQKHNLAHVKSLIFSTRGTLYETSLVINTCKRIVSVLPELESLDFHFNVDELPIEKVYVPPRLRVGKLYQEIFEVVAMAPKLLYLAFWNYSFTRPSVMYPGYRMDQRTRNIIKRSLPRKLQEMIYNCLGDTIDEPLLQAVRELRVSRLRYGSMFRDFRQQGVKYCLRKLNIAFADGMDVCLRFYRISLYHSKLVDCGLVSSQRQRGQARDRYMDVFKGLYYSVSIEESGIDKSWRELETESREAEQKMHGVKAFPESVEDQDALGFAVEKWTNAICRMTALLLSEIPEHLRFID